MRGTDIRNYLCFHLDVTEDKFLKVGRSPCSFTLTCILLFSFKIKNHEIIYVHMWYSLFIYCFFLLVELLLTQRENIYLRCPITCFNTYWDCEMITIIKLINIFITSHSYFFLSFSFFLSPSLNLPPSLFPPLLSFLSSHSLPSSHSPSLPFIVKTLKTYPKSKLLLIIPLVEELNI